MTPKHVMLHGPQVLMGRLGYFSCLQDHTVMSCSPAGAADPVQRQSPQTQCFHTRPAVPRGDTDSVTSTTPSHELYTAQTGVFYCASVCSVWIIPLPPGSPKMTAINPSFPRVPRELSYPNPPQLPTTLLLPQ